MSNVLVTGGAGFIGSHLVDQLVKEGHNVTVLDNLESQVHGSSDQLPDYYNHDARFIKGDVRSLDDIRKAIKGIDIVFHEAAMVGVGQSMYQIKKYVDVNSLGTACLLEVILENRDQIKKLVVASSMSIYGEGTYNCDKCGDVEPFIRSDEQMQKCEWELKCPKCGVDVKPVKTSENKPLDPTSIYAVTKKDQEELCLSFGRAYKIPTVALRYFNVYGPRQSLDNPYTGVCAIFSSRIKNNNAPIVYEDGLQTRNFISVHDIVQANMLAMNEDGMNYNVYNVGSSDYVSVLDIAKTLSKLYGKDLVPDVQNKFRAGDIRHCFSNIEKIQKYGFNPSVDFESGMKELVEWGETVEAEDKVTDAQEKLLNLGLVK